MSKNKIYWWRTQFTEQEINKIGESIRNESVSMGKVTEEFELQLAGKLNLPYVVCVTSGSTALLMALMALGIKQGDEIIIPNRTWVATAHAPLMLGAKPVLVDVLPDRPIIDTKNIERKINQKTKAIMPVQLNGRAVEMDVIWELAGKYNLSVIEDSAQGLFSKYKGIYNGTNSDAGCFSFSIAKLIPTGQGGFIGTKDKSIYKNLKLMRTHGVDDVNAGTPYTMMGFNFRYTDLQASIGLIQLKKINQRITNLIEIHEKYRSGFENNSKIEFMNVDVENGEIPLYSEILIDEREKVIDFLKSKNIETRPFYPDLDTASHLKSEEPFPNSRLFGSNGLVLPSGPDQSLDDIDRVISVINNYI